jgi:gliding motility-associated lipoprotein GldD
MKWLKNSALFILFCFFAYSCEEVYVPKQKAYLRIKFPEKQYVKFDKSCPYTFEYPNYCKVLKQQQHADYLCWYDITFLPFNGELHLSYKKIDDNLSEYIEDTRSLTYKHAIKANDIKEIVIKNDSTNTYGLLYLLKGNTASSVQFFLTDSTQHFLRGALYFRASPNSDSIAPVLDFVKEDIEYLINTFEWK